MKKILFSFSVLILSISAVALAQNTAELREKAKKEAEVDVKKQMQSASDAQVNGVLILQDPYREEIRRSWKWYLGLEAQKITPSGFAQIPGIATESLDLAGSTTLPAINFGMTKDLTTTGSWSWAWGVDVKGGLSSQSVNLTLPSGYKPQNTRLNTSVLKAGPTVILKNTNIKNIALQLGPQIGTLAYTQTSQDGVANFAETSAILGYQIAIQYDLNQSWQIGLKNEKNQLAKPEEKTIAIQNDSYSVGARVIW